MSNFASLARSKLHSALLSGARDNLSLHRWVLLKNSISQTHPSNATPMNLSDVTEEEEDEEEDVDVDVDVDVEADEDMFSFLFPDPDDASDSGDDGSVSEAQWLDSLLETLGDDEDDAEAATQVPIIPDDDEALMPTGIVSPLYSLDDSINAPLTAMHYPVPYPPFHPPLMHTFSLDSDSSFSRSSIDAFPCCVVADSFLPMSEAIEDSSDDESDAPITPFTRSRSSLSLVDPTTIPLPGDQPRVWSDPLVYNDANNSLFFPFQLDSIPYPDINLDSTPVYATFHQNC